MSIHARKHSLLAAALLIACGSHAQTANTQSPDSQSPESATSPDQAPASKSKTSMRAADVIELQRVVVSGADASLNQSTAAKFIVTQDDLTRFGDTTIADALKRVPGISVNGAPGRGGEIRMRGLGNGYTQILLNGEPVAPGFSLDSLAPNLIERIEVVRSATADQSAQAIAGTVNIILKKSVRKQQGNIKFSAASENDEPAFNLDLQQSDKIDTTGYTVSANLKSQKFRGNWITNQTLTDAAGQQRSRVLHAWREHSENYTASFTPRVTWQLNTQDSLIGDGFVSYQRGIYGNVDERSFLIGAPRLYGDTKFSQQSYTFTARAGATFSHEFADAATFETKFTLNANRRKFLNHRLSLVPGESFDDDAEPSLQRSVSSLATDSGFASTGKYRMPLHEKHTLAFGWDAESSRRLEDRIQDDFVARVAPPENLDEDYSVRVYRLAFFAQGDWEITKIFSAYTGLRWEGLQTESGSNEFATVNNRSSVWSPSLQLLWKIPGTKKDQLRAGIARTYKAPATRDLIARRFRTDDNTPTTPDGEGNPDLLPETAWGLDISYEYHFLESSSLNANVFTRRIDDVMQPQLFLDGDRWVTHPINKGGARIHGIELELKTALRDIDRNFAAIELRANLNRNWSRVDAVPGPDNRLANQETLNANIGADWKLQHWPLTLGGNYGFKQGSTVRTAANVQTWSDAQRSLDLYALWKIDKGLQLRFSGSNLLAQDIVRGDDYFAENTLSQNTTIDTERLFRIAFEAFL